MADQLRGSLMPNVAATAQSSIWQNCAAHSLTEQDYQNRLNDYLIGLMCAKRSFGRFVAERLILRVAERRPIIQAYAKGLLSADGTLCPGAEGIDESVKALLVAAAPARISPP